MSRTVALKVNTLAHCTPEEPKPAGGSAAHGIAVAVGPRALCSATATMRVGLSCKWRVGACGRPPSALLQAHCRALVGKHVGKTNGGATYWHAGCHTPCGAQSLRRVRPLSLHCGHVLHEKWSMPSLVHHRSLLSSLSSLLLTSLLLLAGWWWFA